MQETSGYFLKMKDRINTKIIGCEIISFDVIDSTNSYAKRMGTENVIEGMVIVAGQQRCGRGRLGREWMSPPDTGLYMSIILKPSLQLEEIQLITLMASVAVARAIEKTVNQKPGIKWPNDILLGGKKVCGILSEMVSSNEGMEYIVVGIGINVSAESSDFPEALADKATSLAAYVNEQGLSLSGDSKDKLFESVLEEMDKLYMLLLSVGCDGILSEWKHYSATLGNEIVIKSENEEISGVAEGITVDGRLTVLLKNGTRLNIHSGEVSIRGLMGYV